MSAMNPPCRTPIWVDPEYPGENAEPGVIMTHPLVLSRFLDEATDMLSSPPVVDVMLTTLTVAPEYDDLAGIWTSVLPEPRAAPIVTSTLFTSPEPWVYKSILISV